MSGQAESSVQFQFISGNSRVHNGHTFSQPTDEQNSARLNQPVGKLPDLLYKSLRFDQIHARRQTLRSPSPDTCSWILDTHEFKAWVNPDEISYHHGLLWIKGKPGAGKSILMNYLLGESKTQMPDFNVISFFFNARGHELERTAKGLYQSLLWQIMETFPDTKRVFVELGFTNPDLIEQNGWQEESLKNLISYAIRKLDSRKLVCYIDALDECLEEQARSMVTFFQEISWQAMKQGDRLNVCFSSRHYPNMSIIKGLTLLIDGQDGHMIDIQRYIDSTLVIDSSQSGEDIKSRILKKASGVFLWVALVIPMLNKAFDSGKTAAVNKLLDELPTELSLLFHDMLMRDSEVRDSEACDSMLLCIQLVLLAKRPLSLEELYCGIKAGLNDPIPHGSLLEDYTMRRYILSSSKGLVEEVCAIFSSSMQFIHESVREFFILDGYELRGIVRQYWPHLSSNFIGKSQDAIKEACFSGMMIRMPDVDVGLMDYDDWLELVSETTEAYPFLEYAVSNVLFHSNEAQLYEVQQSDWIKQFPLHTWIGLRDICRLDINIYTPDVNILYVPACEDLIHLVKQSPDRLRYINIRGYYGTHLLAALS
ncbi:hypothetical protein F4813DRAFT_211893 [Daldinia decipiens]|uniref:uncharacterized protein n=1 Tax=Daldinia decipiens TaxID=326647 RepID=UPI0020C3C745|nr:uncharacterized protein F4813DRAFT_211893 [Daldinia decipiens]KAI1654297.1 hypothetical protein F4813DRAFT_211893 [Daldinia decipiens]